MSQFSVFVGIDVSKDHLDVHVLPEGQSWRVANDETGCAELSARLSGLSGSVLVVMEATNVFWRMAATRLASAGLSAAVVNPRQVRDFARATGQLAKTDAIDAHVLALFAQRIEPPVRALPSEQCQIAAELLARRAQLMGMRVAEKNRLSSAGFVTQYNATLDYFLRPHSPWVVILGISMTAILPTQPNRSPSLLHPRQWSFLYRPRLTTFSTARQILLNIILSAFFFRLPIIYFNSCQGSLLPPAGVARSTTDLRKKLQYDWKVMMGISFVLLP